MSGAAATRAKRQGRERLEDELKPIKHAAEFVARSNRWIISQYGTHLGKWYVSFVDETGAKPEQHIVECDWLLEHVRTIPEYRECLLSA